MTTASSLLLSDATPKQGMPSFHVHDLPREGQTSTAFLFKWPSMQDDSLPSSPACLPNPVSSPPLLPIAIYRLYRPFVGGGFGCCLTVRDPDPS